ncbi:EcsC family protein [Gephyromycinifex aptenodytis]|uniref:EcsC family protein n=1 Tax=Gephyromycinifex aptenodytis TaxID=2716227 RepID=UPI001D007BB3|nr:EcsC family protein [Gephyromycinifex aptenodytis]
MGIFDIFGGNKAAPTPMSSDDLTGLSAQGAKMVERLLDVGIDGKASFDSASKVAREAQSRRSDPERAIDDIVGQHMRLVAGNGFVTGLGGFITLPVALPANVVGFYVLATRMVAAIAAVRGYELKDEGVRAAVLLSLVGADASDLLKKVGYTSSGRLASLAAERMPGPVMMAINKGVGFRLVTSIGRGTFTRMGRAVPFLGGAVGAGVDTFLLNKLADYVRQEFPVKATLTGLPPA